MNLIWLEPAYHRRMIRKTMMAARSRRRAPLAFLEPRGPQAGDQLHVIDGYTIWLFNHLKPDVRLVGFNAAERVEAKPSDLR
jgi:hypothetical protein